MFGNATLLGQPSYFGFGGGFVGGNPNAQGPESQNYFEDLRQQMAERAARAEQRKRSQLEEQMSNREMTLKELLGGSQMREASRAGNLAQQRLGLDTDVASSDANQRANALSLQERLGWAGENRMSAADQSQQRFQQQQLGQSEAERALRERLGLMSENRLSSADQAQQGFQQQQLGQQGLLAMLPYQRMTKADESQREFANRSLNQQGELARLPYQARTQDSLADSEFRKQELSQRGELARMPFERQTKDQQEQTVLEKLRLAMQEKIADRPYSEQTMQQRLEGVLDRARMKQQGELARMPYQQMTKGDEARLAQDRQQFEGVSGSSRFATEAQERMHQDNQLSEDWWRANQLTQGELDRTQRGKLAGEENAVRRLGVAADMWRGANVPVSEDFQEGLVGALSEAFPQLRNSPIANPQERQTRTMLENLRQGAETDVSGDGKKPSTPEELHKANWETAKRIDAARQAGHFNDAATRQYLNQLDRKAPAGVGTVQQFLDILATRREKAAAASKSYNDSGFIWTGQ